MTKRSKKLKGKIRACCGIARTGGVIAAAAMALVSKGYGVALRYQIYDHIPPGSPQRGYDIDQDGDSDVFFDTGSDPNGVLMEAERDVYAGGGNTGFIYLIPPAGQYLVAGYQADVLINPPTAATTALGGHGSLNSGDDGAFYNQPSPRYAAFTFVGPDTLLHYAWAELRVTGSLAEGYGLSVVAVGYETEPDTGIQTGRPLIPAPTKSTTWGRIKSLYDK